jgi:p-aminobenzoyl-glutamate transporter AbgT
MSKTAADDKVDIYEESSSSESQIMPGSSPEGEEAQEDKEMKNRIIKKEEKAVRNARLLVIAAVIACAVAVSTAIYIFASRSDQSTFELEASNTRSIHCSLQPVAAAP